MDIYENILKGLNSPLHQGDMLGSITGHYSTYHAHLKKINFALRGKFGPLDIHRAYDHINTIQYTPKSGQDEK